MKRREALKISGKGIGLGLSAGALMNVITSCRNDVNNQVNTRVFSSEEFEFMEELSEVILPKADTPGAKEVEVAAFIDHFVSKVYDNNQLAGFKKNLRKLIGKCRSEFGEEMIQLNAEDKISFVKSLESSDLLPEINIWGNVVDKGSELPFYKQLKSMILWGYFSSEKVGKEVLLYQPLAPGYQGCVDVTEETRLPSV